METLTAAPPPVARRRGPRLLVVLSGALLALAVTGLVGPGSYVAVAWASDSFFVLLALAVVAFSAGRAWGSTTWRGRLGYAGLGSVLVALWLAGAWVLGVPFGDAHDLAAVRAPGASHYRAVARDDPGAIFELVTLVRIEQSTGLLARDWTVGCVSGDDDSDGFIGLGWQDATHLRIITSENVYRVTVDARTGRPQQVPDGFGC